MPVLLGLLDHHLDVVRIKSVENIEEVGPVRDLTLLLDVGQVPQEAVIALELTQDISYAELIILGHCDPLHLI